LAMNLKSASESI